MNVVGCTSDQNANAAKIFMNPHDNLGRQKGPSVFCAEDDVMERT